MSFPQSSICTFWHFFTLCKINLYWSKFVSTLLWKMTTNNLAWIQEIKIEVHNFIWYFFTDFELILNGAPKWMVSWQAGPGQILLEFLQRSHRTRRFLHRTRRVPIIKIEEKSIIKRLCHIYLGLCIFPESFVVLRSTLGEGVGSAEVIVISVDFPIINSHLHTT